MEQVKVILNPYAGRGTGGRSKPRLQAALKQAGVAFDLVETNGIGHAIELARQARSDGYSTVAAVGGDGTISEVMNGLAQATPEGQSVGKLGILPLGTGNDFADIVGCPRDLDAAARALAVGKTRRVDLGHTVITTGQQEIRRYFDNNMGVGFEAWVTLESYKIKRLRGALLYVVAALRTLRTCPAPFVDATWETAAGVTERRADAALMISIGNSRRTGGGFYLTPDAKLDDGLLDVGVAAAVSRWRILRLLPKALKGTHTSDPAITMLRCRYMRLACTEELPVQVDGEVVTRNADLVEISVQPGRLEVIV
jgi:YegS/Rv2252/BmrU family lipid kinase